MICPKCQKKNNKEESIDFISNINSFKRTRKCDCGNKFTTFEVVSDVHIDKASIKFDSLIKRKIPKRTKWQDWRFLCYARQHYLNVLTEIKKILKKKNLEKKFEDGTLEVQSIESNIRGKICYQFKDIKTNKEYKFLANNLKMRSIRKVLAHPDYWTNRKLHLNKQDDPSEQEKKDEERQFVKSLNHKKTGIRSSKYNLQFLKQDDLLKDYFISRGEEEFWFMWKNTR